MNVEPKVTRKMQAVNPNLVVETCCEPECATTILVDKDEKASGRQVRCVACMMRMKIQK